MKVTERIVEYDCMGDRVYGVIHIPEAPISRGILALDRVGVHRQTVIWARQWAQRGIPVMRFDLRGRGDSEGRVVTLEETGEDMRHAMDGFFETVPELKDVVLVGLSQGASIGMMYAPMDRRVCGNVMGNPWIRVTDQELARRHLLSHLTRVFDPVFWSRIRNSESGLKGAAKSFFKLVRNSVLGSGRKHEEAAKTPAATVARGVYELPTEESNPLRERLVSTIKNFKGKVFLILSGADPAAAAFKAAMSGFPQWPELLYSGKITMREMEDANHLFSRRDWRDTFSAWVYDWITAGL